jgi:2-oxoglutarate dehydrogenase E1 component
VRDERLDDFYGPNAGYALELLEREAQPAQLAAVQVAVAEAPSPELRGSPEVSAAAAAAALAQSIRLFGHRAARVDPLGSDPPGDPHLEYTAHGLREEDLTRLPASVVAGPVARALHDDTALDAIRRLEQIYTSTTGYEIAHVEDPDERAWLLDAIEEQRFRPPRDPVDERELLDRLTEVSAFERFLHRAYPGQTRFSVEGLGMLIPMLDELIADAASQGTRTVLLGMAHRGRLNVLAHVLGKPYERILAEFEGRAYGEASRAAGADGLAEGWAGDVKYHAGARRVVGADYPRADRVDGTNRHSITVVMAPNPSHLEFVNPVVQGMARAANDAATDAGASALAVLIHGDASFPGQGIVAETLNLGRLDGYATDGTLHLIANNQLGFTTEPRDGRSTLYASDLAKGFEMPIVHVNADDPIACLAAIRLAAAYRARFAKDFLVDLIGYRRWGHNEGDDPSFTQPRTYAAIDKKPTVRELFAADLVGRGVVRPGDPEAFLKAGLDEFQRIRERVRREPQPSVEPSDEPPVSQRRNSEGSAFPGPTWARLKSLNTALLTFPEGFNVHPKLSRALERRRTAFDKPDGAVDWGHAESLAFGTLLQSGVPIRLTGQDAIRGTFSQRHLAFYDTRTGQGFIPLARLSTDAAFAVFNSPLSENATLGFEYGYTIQSPRTLVLWEGQYGDFIDGAQVIVDEFVVSAQAKWGLVSGLIVLLPHAWEGQGPDHSSGRLERFLGLAAQNNLRIANCTTAAQYYFLLRRQAGGLDAADGTRPLIVMSPKSLLRHPLAASRASDLVDGRFQPVLDDARAAQHPHRIRRVVLCSGHIWAELQADRRRGAVVDLAVIRIEELYPFPRDELFEILDKYAAAQDTIWVQEEPRNMGAWTFVEHQLRGTHELHYVGRPPQASPAEGWAEAHAAEQRRIISEVLGTSVVHAD